MAELTLFGYRHQHTTLHSLDARVKLAALAAISLASLSTGYAGLALASLAVLAAINSSRTPVARLFLEIRLFLLFLVCVFLARAVTTSGEVLFSTPLFSITRQGLTAGLLLCWRLLLIALLGLNLTATTRTLHMRMAIEWYLSPIPLIPHHNVSTMIGLLMRFIPVVFSHARDIDEAQKARGIENRRNPVFRMTRLGMPLLRRIFVTADRLAMAMEARSYGDQRTVYPWRLTGRDWGVLVFIAVLCAAMLTLL